MSTIPASQPVNIGRASPRARGISRDVPRAPVRLPAGDRRRSLLPLGAMARQGAAPHVGLGRDRRNAAPGGMIGFKDGPAEMSEERWGGENGETWRPGAPRAQPPVVGSLGLSFSAGGLLFPYYVGVAAGLRDAGKLAEVSHVAGASAGAIIAACIGAELDLDVVMEATKGMYHELQGNGTVWRVKTVLRGVLEEVLPPDAHLRVRGRTSIAVTQVLPFPRGELVTEFRSKSDLVDAILASAMVPLWLDPAITTPFREGHYMDGGLWPGHMLPPTPCERTIRVTGFDNVMQIAMQLMPSLPPLPGMPHGGGITRPHISPAMAPGTNPFNSVELGLALFLPGNFPIRGAREADRMLMQMHALGYENASSFCHGGEGGVGGVGLS